MRVTQLILAAVLAATIAATGCTYYDEPAGYTDDGDEYYADDYYYDDEPVGVFDRFEELQYWGQWMDIYPYGEVWRPTVVLGWQPYSHGHWMWSAQGWTWVSYEPFGWITYHYGYWGYDDIWGWFWIPDYDWSPANVEWVVYDNYIAWAPLPPPGFAIGQPWIVSDAYVWHVVPASEFMDPDIGSHQVSYKSNYRVKARSSVKYKAPPAEYVERSAGKTLRAVPIEFARRVERGDRIIKQLQLPPSEAERADRYRKDIEEQIREKNPPEREIRKPERPARQGDQDVREPERRKEPARDTKDRKKFRKRDNPPQKKEPAKKEPRKKEPRKKEPAKKERDGKDKDTSRGFEKKKDSGKDRDS
jgi:hypothetical protein